MPVVNRTVRLRALLTQPMLVLIAGQVVVALSGLFYGKLTALYIPPAEWGNYGLILASMTLGHSLLITPTLQSFKAALARFSPNPVIGFYRRMLTMIYLTVALVTALLAGMYYQNFLFGLVWVAATGQGVYQFGNDFLNALGHHRQYALVQAGYALSTILIFCFLVVGADAYTATALWQSLALLNTVFAVLSWWRLSSFQRRLPASSAPTVNYTALNQAYGRYISPLLGLAFWNWLINYADRYLIRLYVTEAAVGQYAMGYSIGSKLLILVAPVLTFLSPQVLRLRAAGHRPATANPLVLRCLLWYVLVAAVVCLGFYTGRDWIGQWLLSDRYQPAFIVGPVVATGYLFLTGIHLLEVKWYAFGQTRFVLWHHVVGAVLNVGLNFVLIPRLGIAGAALATMLGFAGQFLLVLWLFTKYDRI